MKLRSLSCIIYLALIATPPVCAEERNKIEIPFSKKTAWQEKAFMGHTEYKFLQEEDKTILEAQCNASASALYYKKQINLNKTPILQWNWKIDNIYSGLDDISKSGDDYAARIYVIYKGLLPWDIYALNYVWANKQTKGTYWPNAFSDRAMMIALQSGPPKHVKTWRIEERDIKADFKKYLNLDIEKIQGVALMTDCDNGKGTSRAFYKGINFKTK